AQFTESKKQYTVTYKYYDGQQAEISKQTVNAGEDVTFIPAPEVANKKFVSFGYENENGEYVAYAQNGIKNILDNEVVFLTYRDIQKGQFSFYKFEETVAPNEVLKAVAFTEDTVAGIAAPAGPEKADTATVDYTFREWVTFITYADMLERTKEKVVVSDDVVSEAQRSVAIAPNAAAGTKTEDGEWITFAEYMEKYFAIENRDFFPTYSEKEIKNDPVITPPINIIIPIITETPEEPTTTPTAEPTPEPTAEPTPEPVVDIEETETPEGDVVEDLEPIDTPQSAPEEEELDVEPIDTPQGDLPKTGVAPSAVFFGIGAACVVFGGAIVLKLRRKEEM
ncbi:MAG: LPXTG cell wall anchor domain-containing protein, partial [Lachnospiraceae bacterium]|nr:LPXTG cell wall anchor domain-containing protein [Lachnospiraceae bacterium]